MFETITFAEAQLHESIAPIAELALRSGLRVAAVAPRNAAPVGFFYVFDRDNGNAAVVNRASFSAFDPPTVSAPIKPNRDYGSGVLVDYDGSVPDALRALRETIASDTVTVRFMPGGVRPVVKNHGIANVWRGTLREVALP